MENELNDIEEGKTTRKAEASKKGKRSAWSSLVDGGILASDFLRRQTGLIILVVVLTVFYVNNRYECQRELLEIDHLKQDLLDIKYDALTRSSELMERSRQSRIEEYVSANSDEEGLQAATNRPYLIHR
jgi:hypothetical protein